MLSPPPPPPPPPPPRSSPPPADDTSAPCGRKRKRALSNSSSKLPRLDQSDPTPPPPPPSSSSPLASPGACERALFSCHFAGCGKSFVKRGKLERHLRSHTGEKPFVCPVAECGQSFARNDHLKRHSLVHSKERPHVCHHPECGKGFTNAHHLKRHLALHQVPRPFVCTAEGCTASFSKQKKLRQHMSEHSNCLPHSCSVGGCEARFKYPSQLERHLRSHQERESDREAVRTLYACPVPECSKIFRLSRDLHLHTAAVHAPLLADGQSAAATAELSSFRIEQSSFVIELNLAGGAASTGTGASEPAVGPCGSKVPCETCGKPVRPSSMNSHVQTHAPERRLFHCTFNVPVAAAPSRLDPPSSAGADAVTVGTAMRPCGRAFSKANNLKTHIRAVHLKQFSFQCPRECGKSFKHNRSLQAHLKQCTGDGGGDRTDSLELSTVAAEAVASSPLSSAVGDDAAVEGNRKRLTSSGGASLLAFAERSFLGTSLLLGCNLPLPAVQSEAK